MTKGNARSLDKWDGDKFRLSRFLRIKQTLFREPTALTKIMKRFLLLPLLAVLFISFQSCEKDEPGNTPDTPGQETPTPSDPEEPENPGTQTPETPKDQSVVVNQDGTTSTGVPFRWETNSTTIFYLNHVKYKIVDSHIEMVGFDPYELKHSLKGIPTLYSSITLDGYTYLLRAIDMDGPSDTFTFVSSIYSALISIEIPETVVTIKSYSFSGCENLATVKLNSGLETIGYSAFYNCTSLKTINFPSTLENIGYYCFRNCSNLTSIIIPEGTQQLEFPRNAISECYSLKTLSLPSNTNPEYFIKLEGNSGLYWNKTGNLEDVYLPWSLSSYELGMRYGSTIPIKNLHISKNLKSWHVENRGRVDKYYRDYLLYGFIPENIIELEE